MIPIKPARSHDEAYVAAIASSMVCHRHPLIYWLEIYSDYLELRDRA